MFSNKTCWSLRDLWNNSFSKKTNTKKNQTQHYNKLPEKTVILKSVENTHAHTHTCTNTDYTRRTRTSNKNQLLKAHTHIQYRDMHAPGNSNIYPSIFIPVYPFRVTEVAS